MIYTIDRYKLMCILDDILLIENYHGVVLSM